MLPLPPDTAAFRSFVTLRDPFDTDLYPRIGPELFSAPSAQRRHRARLGINGNCGGTELDLGGQCMSITLYGSRPVALGEAAGQAR